MRLLIRFGFAAFNARIESYVEEKNIIIRNILSTHTRSMTRVGELCC